ncbi:type II toxin-antitoxin system prevent-host-death family antitoxin [Enterobacter bugandensis]|nr:type II toxin-antitoxin system prevent-host-death family antitoxin [Enterobacter bugandensis]
MRKVSYTQMRAELSDILDAIRNGETVVVTQRGRPDTVLNGSLVLSANENENVKYVTTITTPSGKKIYPSQGKYFKITFGEALSKTKTKHAKIIKALEDK